MCVQVNATTIDGVTPLFNACSAGSSTCTEVLLEHGANPQSDLCQPSPIHEASSKGESPFLILECFPIVGCPGILMSAKVFIPTAIN